MPNFNSPMPRWRRFSLRFLLVAIAVCAVGLGAWRAFFYQHPAHKFPYYNWAPYTSGYKFRAGPNTIAIRSIARNRYDGSIQMISRGGLRTQIPNVDSLTQCATWLDVVQIEITPGPELVEIVEVRVLDHETRMLLSGVDQAFGWRVTESNCLQVYGLGKEVPAKLDVWLRLHSFADDTIYTIGTTPGSKVDLPGGTIRVAEVKENFSEWDKEHGFSLTDPGGGSGSAVLFDWQGDWQGTPLMVTAISDLGEREYSGEPMKPEWRGSILGPKWSRFPLELIDHFELRPYCEHQEFFFDGVDVPSPVGRTFDPPPIATIETHQRETAGTLQELAPLWVQYRVEAGSNVSGFLYSNVNPVFARSGPRQNRDSECVLLFKTRGLGDFPLCIRMRSAEPKAWTSLGPSAHLSRSTNTASMKTLFRPIEEVDAIDVKVDLAD